MEKESFIEDMYDGMDEEEEQEMWLEQSVFNLIEVYNYISSVFGLVEEEKRVEAAIIIKNKKVNKIIKYKNKIEFFTTRNEIVVLRLGKKGELEII